MARIDLICDQCGTSFSRRMSEYKRCLRRDQTTFFCSRSCATLHNNALRHASKIYANSPENIEHLVNMNKSRKGRANPFKFFMKVVRKRKNNGSTRKVKDFNVDELFLKELWERQGGKCGYTGKELVLPVGSNGFEGNCPVNGASLDRIDSDRGYFRDNVHFVCHKINLMKNDTPDARFKEELTFLGIPVVDLFSGTIDVAATPCGGDLDSIA